jgi:phage pi2 protein 07
MRKHAIVLFAALAVFVPYISGCVQTPEETTPKNIKAGEIKISYFLITDSVMKKGPTGSYQAIVSKDWYAKRRRKMNEPFEKLNLPPDYPSVRVAEDDLILELAELLEKEGFYSLPGTDLKWFTLEKISDPAFRTRTLTMERNGMSYSLAMEKLNPEERKKFLRIKNIFLAHYARIPGWNTDVMHEKEMQEFIKEHFNKPQQPQDEKKD